MKIWALRTRRKNRYLITVKFDSGKAFYEQSEHPVFEMLAVLSTGMVPCRWIPFQQGLCLCLRQSCIIEWHAKSGSQKYSLTCSVSRSRTSDQLDPKFKHSFVLGYLHSHWEAYK